jgi:pilus assembly protein CpaB
MRRSPRVLLAWAAAIIVMLATARVVTDDLGALHRRAHDLGTDVAVVLAARDLPLGTTVGAADVRVVHRPSTTVPADAVHDPAAAVGRIVAVALLRDDVVGDRHLVAAEGSRAATAGGEEPGPGINGVVPAGRRAVHVVVKDGFAPPIGAVVDVLATFDPSIAVGAGSPGRATVVARGARVLAGIGTAQSSGSGTDASGTSGSGVALLVTEAEAAAVAYAASIGEIALALDPPQSACCAASPS